MSVCRVAIPFSSEDNVSAIGRKCIIEAMNVFAQYAELEHTYEVRLHSLLFDTPMSDQKVYAVEVYVDENKE